ncbi:MAG: hypothetical protein GF333_01970 [Candidatus Omnitrophica bacterium]|nr:hypothetical protein [Candidatus Omnitrophota bacterium]
MGVVSTAIRLIVAFLCGSLLGFERERKSREAGLRTHILVCVGSALFMLISLHVYEAYPEADSLDPSRIAAGVVTGIGFLGAGTIIRSQEGIRGLTTAASVWMSSAIGLAVGSGYYIAAIIATVIAYLCLSSLKRVEKRFER